jgi:hypothetical protein
MQREAGNTMPSILFVCTGNIFRSMTAEYALKAYVFRGSEASDPGDIWTLTMKVAGDGVYQNWERGHPAQPARLP